MREILFRGKRILGGEWIYGSLVTTERGMFIAPPGEEAKLMFGSCKVNSKTVGQFTGLLDKNGVRIFEGDVLLSVDEELGNMYAEVVFEKGAFLIKEPGYDAELFLGEELGDFEIAGNVFENKELLEVE